MKWKSFFDNPEELMTGFCLQLPLWQITKLWTIPIALICSVLWRLGGWEHGEKMFRWLCVPLIVCVATYKVEHQWAIFLAVPFMVKIAPSYGEKSWLFKLLKNDFYTRLVTYFWYWAVFSLCFMVK